MVSLLAALLCGLPGIGLTSIEADSMREKLDEAKVSYAKAMKEYEAAVKSWFEDEDKAARKASSGVAARVKKVVAEKVEFGKSGVLPGRFPAAVRAKGTNAIDAMTKSYKATIDAYYRQSKDGEAAIIEKEFEEFEKNRGAGVNPLDDSFPLGSVWVCDQPKSTLTVLVRNGDSFRARFVVGDKTEREVTGIVKDNKLSWLGRDVRAIKGATGGDNHGNITADDLGPKIDFVWRGDKGTSGAFTLRLLQKK